MKISLRTSTLIIIFILNSAVFTPLIAGHFIPVWTGNPFNPMTIIVTEAKISGVDLANGDEIGVFDGAYCVGRAILTQTIIPSNSATYIYLTCSKDDPGTVPTDGYIEGHTIIYKLWKQSTNHETEFVTHTFPFSPNFVFETFLQNETTVISLAGVNVPAVLSVQNMTIENGQTNCYDATDTITVAGNGTSFSVQAGGVVTMVSGKIILYLPGTTVVTGGYMRGYITSNGLYCDGLPPIAPSSTWMNSSVGQAERDLFTVFPNPTKGKFRVKPLFGVDNQSFTFEVFQADGKRILLKSGNRLTDYEQNIEIEPMGIYFLRITLPDQVVLLKLIKN